jgi:CubicO group peptidase (beta-lactamase class C family)
MPSSLVMLTLVQDGLINLDEPIGTYLQGHIDVPADKAAITTRMLLNHTSGLNNKPACEFRPKSTLQACAQEILNDPLQFAPGTEFA